MMSFSPVLMTAIAALLGKSDATESLFGSLAVNGSAFRAATGWTPPVAQQVAFNEVAAWYKQAKGSR